ERGDVFRTELLDDPLEIGGGLRSEVVGSRIEPGAIWVAGRDMLRVRDRGGVRLPPAGVSAPAQRRQRGPVIALPARDHDVLRGEAAVALILEGHLDRVFSRLRSAGDEPNAIQSFGCELFDDQ